MEREQIEKLALMTRLALSDDEIEAMRDRVGSVVGYVAQVSDIATDGEQKVVGILHNVMRPDVRTREPNEYTEAVLANAPATQGRFIAVKKVIDAN